MYKYNGKKDIVKVLLILLFATLSIYLIYNKFDDERVIESSSLGMDVIFKDNSKDKISITKVTPVTDSVGLSSNAYNIILNNNLTEKNNYRIEIIDDVDFILDDECDEYLIPKENIRISVKCGKKESKIYTLSELENNTLLIDKLNALEEKDIAIRLWVSQNSTLPLGSNMHYHGIIKVIDED